MPAKERVEIIKELGFVDIVIESIDKDRTVCETLATVEPKPDYFCNGGDQVTILFLKDQFVKKRYRTSRWVWRQNTIEFMAH